jgi:hypothetical protein
MTPQITFGGAAVAALVAAFGFAAVQAEVPLTKIDIAGSHIGSPPADFDFAVTGEGELGRWAVERDATATAGAAIEHRSEDPHEDRFPLAIYRPLTTENVEFAARLKIISGTLLAAGVALGVRNPNSYYALVVSALEHRADLLLVVNGKVERIESAEADVERDRWHELRVRVNDDHFTVTLDGTKLITAYDRSRRNDGRIALWTQEDNVTRFDRIEIRPLPDTEYR